MHSHSRIFCIYEQPPSKTAKKSRVSLLCAVSKKVFSLNVSDINRKNVIDVLNEEFIKVLMLGQQVPEVYDISSKIRTHEDFNKSLPGNYDLINFHNKWTHCKT